MLLRSARPLAHLRVSGASGSSANHGMIDRKITTYRTVDGDSADYIESRGLIGSFPELTHIRIVLQIKKKKKKKRILSED